MTKDLELLLRGPGAEAAADALAALLGEGGPGPGVPIARRPADAAAGGRRKAVDPVAVAALVLSIPSAALAAWDLTTRIQARRKAEKVVEAARRLRLETGTDSFVLTLEGPRALDTLDPDRLLELAAAAQGTRPAGDGEEAAG